MTLFEKLTGAATSVVFVAGILAAVLLPGAGGVTVSAQAGPGAEGGPMVPSASSHDPAPTQGSPGSAGSGSAADPGSGVDAGTILPGHGNRSTSDRSTPTSVVRSRASTTTLPVDALDLLDQLVGLVPATDLDALTDLLDSLDPSVLDDVLDQLAEAIDTGTIEQLVGDLLGEADLPVPTTLPPLTVPDATVPLDDPTGAVDDVVDDTTSPVDDVLEDPTGVVDDTTGTLDETTDSVTETITDTVDGLL